MTKYKIAVIDSYRLFLDFISSGLDLDPKLEVACQILDESDQCELDKSKVDLVVLGSSLGNFGGLGSQAAMTRKIKAGHPDSKVLLIVRPENSLSELVDAFRAGAQSAITTQSSKQEMMEALHATLEGGEYLPRTLGLNLVEKSLEQTPLPLSIRESEVLSGLAFGYTNQEIAQKLHLSIRTIESQRAGIQEKLGISSRHQIVSYAMQHNLMSPDSEWCSNEPQELESS